MRKLWLLLLHTWLAIVRHDWTQEPGAQRWVRRWMVYKVHAMEYDPHTQWRFHLFMTWFWLASAAPILVLFFGFQPAWLRWGLLITLIYSLYANFVSDFTGVHAAWAAFRGDQISEQQVQEVINDEISDSQQLVFNAQQRELESVRIALRSIREAVELDALQRELASVHAALRSLQEAAEIKRQAGMEMLPESLTTIGQLQLQEKILVQKIADRKTAIREGHT